MPQYAVNALTLYKEKLIYARKEVMIAICYKLRYLFNDYSRLLYITRNRILVK
jgi:hypothetical protein